MNQQNYTDGLKTLNEDGSVPTTRMASARDASDRVTQFQWADRQGRSQRRATVKGLVDGNPPYKQYDMVKAGRAGMCNVNWRIPESYLNMSRYAFYDVFSESPTYCSVRTDFGTPSQRVDWSGIITEEFDYLIRTDKSWDRVNQFSIYDMVLYGCGPMVFFDDIDWRNDFACASSLLVPDFSPSDPEEWEECAITLSYLPHQLYEYIQNPKAATKMGWNVETVKQAIMRAHKKYESGGMYQSWEWHQQQYKNRSYSQSAECKTIQAAHYWYREFPENGQRDGKISHCIVINPEDGQTAIQDYLFHRVGRYDSWNQIVHPMYYDNDGGGYHHSVTGLGIKMYSAMEYQNRLLCNIADKAFAPKLFFKSLNANSSEQMSLVQFGEYGVMPKNFEIQQTPVQSHLEESLVLNRELSGMLASNLSQYRSNLSKEQGNPITAYETSVRVSEQSRLGKTQLSHYYNQLDWLYAEKYRRATNPKLTGFMPGGREAYQFQDACKKRGVPMEALRKVESVKATRIVGQGSQFMRQQVLQEMLAVSAMIPSEEGRNNVLNDFIAAKAGQVMVERYNPQDQNSPEIADQVAMATLQAAAAKDGVPPVVGGSQNHLVFAQTFLRAAGASVESLNKGGDPNSVLVFLSTIIPATAQHAQYLKNDPSRQKEVKMIEQQLQQFMQVQKQLGMQIAKMNEARKQQAAKQQQIMTTAQLDQFETQSKVRNQDMKTQADMRRKDEKTRQEMALKDMSTAADISIKDQTSKADIAIKARNGESSSSE